MSRAKRIIVVDPRTTSREVLACRLTAQGYLVEQALDPAMGADMALSSPPSAVVADLWMPGISGVQLCRLLRSEAATSDVPVILRGEETDARSRFWAARAGAVAYVERGRFGELVRALATAVAARPEDDGFFVQRSCNATDVRDRIAQHLDAALFESVIASEVRALATSGSFDALFDRFCQFLAQVHGYRWLAVMTSAPARFALHHHPRHAATAEVEARAALSVPRPLAATRIEDEDAMDLPEGPPPLLRHVEFGGASLGTLAMAPEAHTRETDQLLDLVARELGGAIRMASLVEESQRLATVDVLTGMMNRRAFGAAAQAELARSLRHDFPLSLLLLDVDHFKSVNDQRGHATGDRVLRAIGALLRGQLRTSDLSARWGGEEFVVLLPNTPLEGGLVLGERLRAAIQSLAVADDHGDPVQVTASIGVSSFVVQDDLDDLVDRADRGMYEAKHAGRNQVRVLSQEIVVEGDRRRHPTSSPTSFVPH